MPKVTVIIPTYNRAELIGQTLQSVADQTFGDFECVVVDDGSTDDTADRVRAFIDRDGRFRCVRQRNSSAANARNTGIAAARGAYCAFLDSDDLYPPDRLAWQVALLDGNDDAVLVYGDTFHFTPPDTTQGRIYMEHVPDKPAGHAFEALLSCSSIYAPLVRTQVLRDLGGFDTTLASAEDWDMWLRVARQGRILFEPRVALLYRVHEGNKSANTLRNYTCARRVLGKNLRHVPWRRRLRVLARARTYFRRGYTDRMDRAARSLTHTGDWRSARDTWRALIRLNPRRLRDPSTLAHVAWSVLPTARPPWWAHRRPAATARSSPTLDRRDPLPAPPQPPREAAAGLAGASACESLPESAAEPATHTPTG